MTNDDIATLKRNRWLAIRNTPRKVGTRRYLHTSTHYGWVPMDPKNPTGSARFVKLGKGETYRRPT